MRKKNGTEMCNLKLEMEMEGKRRRRSRSEGGKEGKQLGSGGEPKGETSIVGQNCGLGTEALSSGLDFFLPSILPSRPSLSPTHHHSLIRSSASLPPCLAAMHAMSPWTFSHSHNFDSIFAALQLTA